MASLNVTFSATGASEEVKFRQGYYSIEIIPNGSTITWQRSRDGGLTWVTPTDWVFTDNRIIEGRAISPEMFYRFNCTVYGGTPAKCYASDNLGNEDIL
jgi:hypothetical protein